MPKREQKQIDKEMKVAIRSPDKDTLKLTLESYKDMH